MLPLTRGFGFFVNVGPEGITDKRCLGQQRLTRLSQARTSNSSR